MTIPHYDTVRDEPLLTDEAVLRRLDHLLERGLVLRLWLMFLDDDGRQLPLLLPVDVTGPPDDDAAESIGTMLADLVEATGAGSAVVVVEWGELDSACDAIEWMLAAAEACEVSGVAYRGPFECSPFGVQPGA